MIAGVPVAGRPDLLEAIVASTRRNLELRLSREPFAALEARAFGGAKTPRAFSRALASHGVGLIAECKRQSPSRGLLRADYDAARLAVEYEESGAAAISVLTEPTFFDGSLSDLTAVRAAVRIPILRKDFIIDRYQLLEARAAGADAALLIVAALDQASLADLIAAAESFELETLVEVHDEHELKRALDAGARIVGVNNRNLRTLAVDVDVCEALAPSIPGYVLVVAESGLRSGRDVSRLRQLGYRAFLVGEHFVRSPEPGRAVRHMLDEAASCS